MNKIKGYKAFDKDLKCRDFQYEIGGEYTEEGDIKCCDTGFHFCNNPFDVLDYYPLIDDDGEFSRFAKVEGSGRIDKKENKVCVSNIKVIEELKLEDFINNGVEFIQNQTKDLADCESDDSGDYAKIGSSGYSAQIGSSGDSAQIGSSGNYAQIKSSGNYSVVMCAGYDSKARAKKGSWITLAEWKYDSEKNRYIPICVKTEQVDGEIIKEDTFYMLQDGKFVEV